jgi:spermidine synthase
VGFGTSKTTIGLGEQGLAIDLLSTFAGQASNLETWSKDAQINTDRNLRLQYLAGMWLNSYIGTEILKSILEHYRFPDRTFIGSSERIRALKVALAAAGRKDTHSRAQDMDDP